MEPGMRQRGKIWGSEEEFVNINQSEEKADTREGEKQTRKREKRERQKEIKNPKNKLV